MKNAGMAGAVALVGIGLITIGLSNFANRADATPAVTVNAGPDKPVIVAFGSFRIDGFYRLWSDGTIEGNRVRYSTSNGDCFGVAPNSTCQNTMGWFVISSPNEGLNARADINFDSQVNAEDLGIMLAAWDGAPRNDYPPSDCPLGLIP